MATTTGRKCQSTSGAARSTLTKDSERQRSFWSFLTWAFALSEVIAAGSFVGKAASADAQATDQGDEGGKHSASQSGSALDDIPGTASGIVAAADDVQDDEAARHNNSARSMLDLDKVQFGSKPVELQPAANDPGQGASAGGGGGGGGADSGDSSSSGAVDPGSLGSGGSGINVGVDVNQLFGFDVHLGADGVFVGVDSSLELDLNPEYLVSDLAQILGLGDADLHQLLGFDVHLGSDGVFVVSDLVHTVGLNAGLDLNNSLLPQHHGSSSLIDDLSHPTGLPGLADLTNGLTHVESRDGLIYNVFNAAHDPVADVTGVAGPGSGFIGNVTNHVLGLADDGSGLLSGVARIPAGVLGKAGDAGGVVRDVLGDASQALGGSLLTKSLDTLTAQSGNDATLSQSLPAQVVQNVTSFDELGPNGDISSGETINFPAQPLSQVDELFNGNRYTDYNMTLQSHTPDAGKVGGVPISDLVAPTAVSPTPVDIQPVSQDGSAPPLKGLQDMNTSLVQTPTPIEELSGHGHLI